MKNLVINKFVKTLLMLIDYNLNVIVFTCIIKLIMQL